MLHSRTTVEFMIRSLLAYDFALLLFRPLIAVAGGWQHRTKKIFGDAIRAAFGRQGGKGEKELSQAEALVLMCIAYFQPITRAELSTFFGKEVSRDLIGVLRARRILSPPGRAARSRARPTPM